MGIWYILNKIKNNHTAIDRSGNLLVVWDTGCRFAVERGEAVDIGQAVVVTGTIVGSWW